MHATGSRRLGLAVGPDRIIVDSSHPAIFRLAQTSPASYTPTAPLSLHVALAPEAADAKPVKDLGTFELFPRDFQQRPFAVSAEMPGIADGTYRVVVLPRDHFAHVRGASREVTLRR